MKKGTWLENNTLLRESNLSESKEEEDQFLKTAAEMAKVNFFDSYWSYDFNKKDDWSVVLDTEKPSKAEKFRDAVGDLLGVANAYGASYDDIPGMRGIHLGCLRYHEWSEMTGGDVYDDLDEEIRDKFVVFACPAKTWIEYRRQTDW